MDNNKLFLGCFRENKSDTAVCSSYGFGAFGCAIVGLGAGGGGGDWTGGACLAVGLGTGALSCLVNGVSTCQSPGNRG